ncbi:stage III sporulation protein AA [Clostridium sp. 'White wine YQ']|uniref:stage III sporulation protein AA n=1 Tax=Clostridium sp. 'White wine YQ' TaxID=3027474 RepID=UPI00236675E3|nr:stage III sporulation protein AA [Clostridium sp. 'White wine YQ']MDD7793946.1 stage III sporulation protein AA [Clostridium sp. 'White wine YQ']
MNKYSSVLDILPKEVLGRITEFKIDEVQEIRMRANLPLIIVTNHREFISNYICKLDDIKIVAKRMANYSFYAFEEDIKQGFITINGGHRVGITGEWVIDNNKIKTLRNISSVNIRITKELKGVSDGLIPLITEEGRILNTIIISPPKCGKTTLLRDISRNISNGMKGKGIPGRKVSIIDERSEIAGSFQGIPQMDVGIRTDVFDNCIKSEGMLMAIRSMSPEVLICDEIGSDKDVEALISAYNSGVNIITTIHGYDINDLYNRKIFRGLLDNKILKRVIELSNRRGPGTIENVRIIEERD